MNVERPFVLSVSLEKEIWVHFDENYISQETMLALEEGVQDIAKQANHSMGNEN